MAAARSRTPPRLIASISDDEAAEYARAVLARGSSGY